MMRDGGGRHQQWPTFTGRLTKRYALLFLCDNRGCTCKTCRQISPIKCGTHAPHARRRQRRRRRCLTQFRRCTGWAVRNCIQIILAARHASMQRIHTPATAHAHTGAPIKIAANAPRGQFAHKYYKTLHDARRVCAFMLLFLLSGGLWSGLARWRCSAQLHACLACVCVCSMFSYRRCRRRQKSESNRPQILNLAMRCNVLPIYICLCVCVAAGKV